MTKVRQELGIGEMPQPTGVVSHGIDSTRDVMMAGDKTMLTLVESIEFLEQICAGGV